MPLDILAICPHPDDAELHCAGMLLQGQRAGARIGVLDLTRGELGSRGSAESRAREAEAATRILGLDYRGNLGLRDGHVRQETGAVAALVAAIRAHAPKLVAAPHWDDHHPDHAAASALVRDAAFLAGLAKYPAEGAPHRPQQVLYYLDRVSVKPDLVIDVGPVMAQKERALRCYGEQLHAPNDTAPETPLSRPDFIERWRARHMHYGALIGVDYAEAYVLRSPVPIRNPLDLCWERIGMV